MRMIALASVLALALGACAQEAPKEAAAPAHEQAQAHGGDNAAAAAAVRAVTEGEVVVVQPEYGAVTVRHGPIPEYGMDAMTMEFTTTDARKLDGVKAGDRVRMELTGPTEFDAITVLPASGATAP